MSNPVTNAEVEDVLSSIRRLVSSDPRLVDRDLTEETEPSDASEQSGADRLVLTPALRVAAAQDDAATIDVGQPDGETLADSEQDGAGNTEQAGLVSDATPVADGLEADVSECQDKAADQTFDKTKEAGETIEVDDFETALNESSSEIDPEELRFLFRARKRATSPSEAAEINAKIAEAPENIEPEARAVVTAELAEVDKPAPLLLTDPEPSGPAVEDGEGGVENGEQTADDEITESAIAQIPDRRADAVPPEELTAKIAALEAVIAQTPDQWEPDDDGVDEYAGTSVDSLAWEDHVDLDGSGTPLDKDRAERVAHSADAVYEAEAQVEEQVVVPDQVANKDQTWPDIEDEVDEIVGAAEFVHQDAAIVDLADQTPVDPLCDSVDDGAETPIVMDTSILDEVALRELISDIVRQELNGSLGERITHNVRKLVRRELQRALAAEELR